MIQEEEKYFIPDPDDISVGYECEFHGMTTGGFLILDFSEEGKDTLIQEPNVEVWYPIKCGYDPLTTDRSVEDIRKLIRTNQIRTAYLTKEQILNQGWTVMNTGGLHPGCIDGRCGFRKNNHFMVWHSKLRMVDIIIRDPSKVRDDWWSPERFRLFCECKDVNTLKTISNLLKI